MTKPDLSAHWLPLAGAVALWMPAMAAASHEWRYGEYYDYGWFVPPTAIWLMIVRWKNTPGCVVFPPRPLLWGLALMLVPWFLVLRTLGGADPGWRLPILLSGMTAVLAGHWLIAASRGWQVSCGFIWITLLWLSALPWPSVLESGIISQLTRWVVVAVADAFHLFGKPVEVSGVLLGLHGMTVEVADGCSGLRSFQSFVMATWFFAELQRLRAPGALTLLGIACGVAFAVNTARAYTLASIRFNHGETAFNQAHNWLGLLAFAFSAVVFYWVSGLLSGHPRRVLVRSRHGRPAAGFTHDS